MRRFTRINHKYGPTECIFNGIRSLAMSPQQILSKYFENCELWIEDENIWAEI